MTGCDTPRSASTMSATRRIRRLELRFTYGVDSRDASPDNDEVKVVGSGLCRSGSIFVRELIDEEPSFHGGGSSVE